MRYLLFTALALVACEPRDKTSDTRITDSIGVADTGIRSNAAEAEALSAIPDRLLGSWTAQGYDAGSSRPQPFTITWSRSPDGSLGGTVAFRGGETYNVKIVSTSDTTFAYESEPHRSPTLKAQVVTRTQAKLVGDTLTGTYEAKAATGGKVLRGRFTATRGS
jgi:hypothetical protein